MNIKATQTNKIMHSLKEKNVILEDYAASIPDHDLHEVFIEMIEFSVWGFIPSQGILQKGSLSHVGRVLAPFTPEKDTTSREVR